MKKFLPIFLLLMLSPVFGEFIVVPETVPINESVYVIFKWSCEQGISNFNVTINSDAVEFENNSLYYAGVAANAEIIKLFKGKAKKLGNHTIVITMDYWKNGCHIRKKHYLNISIIPKTIIKIKKEVVEKIIVKNETINESSINNITNNKSKNESAQTTVQTINKNNSNIENITNVEISINVNNSQSQKNTESLYSLHSLYYVIGGLLVGILSGIAFMYAIKA
ncbi:hypothetical protein [Methanotorris igneus]|uniref:Uncharacterized protein n=1 Tax=Methanotorris igneus (strain DSM 5666 / JCM 11834 / Kol 5) TaxID=880724 RepID=F6BDZ5_METIK|nr:hypothetical protein [Methanotorris igneus]AEF96706.1 hypothetical protein Metig_1168 [Methanotorris igneus Kol 5]